MRNLLFFILNFIARWGRIEGEIMSENVTGPKAPKDPEKKRQSFCIIKNKEISGSPQSDGSGICFIYESDGRLIDAAKLCGNISDERILDLLKTTEGFRKLVHSIGISVDCDGSDVLFAFQMYGKTDPYVSGTTLTLNLMGDGMEYILDLNEAKWSEDDNIPGQIRFHFSKPGIIAKATVRLYLNDGFDVPKEEEDEPVDISSKGYKEMIGNSLMYMGNTFRLKKAIEKAKAGEKVNVSFIGGSITVGAGAVPINTNCYAYKAFEGFCRLAGRSVNDNVSYTKAGLGGTSSELGILRYERDVLKNGANTPDVVVIEFAVNDAGDETLGKCYESLARKAYNGPGHPAVILLFAVFSSDFNLQERLSPVGFSYRFPMVSIKDAVTKQFYLKPETGRIVSKAQFFYDCFHPNNLGHRIMADSLINLFEQADCAKASNDFDISDIKSPIGSEFEDVKLFDRSDNLLLGKVCEGSFAYTDTNLQGSERDMDLNLTLQFPNNWMYKGGAKDFKPLTLEAYCKALFVIIKDSASIEDGAVKVYKDGELTLTYDPHEVGWTHAKSVLVFCESEASKHTVTFVPADLSKNVTILGFGII